MAFIAMIDQQRATVGFEELNLLRIEWRGCILTQNHDGVGDQKSGCKDGENDRSAINSHDDSTTSRDRMTRRSAGGHQSR
jgi:hypothetical protein